MKKTFLLALVLCFLVTVNTFPQNRKEREIEKSFNFNEPFHSLGFSVFTGINFAPKLQKTLGEIEPILFHSFVPEFILQYNFMIRNGFGIALEVPFGIFSRTSLTKLSNYGASNDVYLEMGSLYIGFTGKITVFKELNKSICMQGELGIKFNPFYHPANKWINKEWDIFNTNDYGITEDNSSINFIKIEQKYYAIPDATTAVLFFFHSQKKPRHNFVLGLNVNLSFVKRIKVNYDTRFSELGLNEVPYIGIGSYGWNSTAIGITFGYRFFGVK
ncbi:MAG: hypothetical protein FWC34_01295 [Bacteroidetes bacterium]|nr:hypothetical protein [Bacteroidota bacterium]